MSRLRKPFLKNAVKINVIETIDEEKKATCEKNQATIRVCKEKLFTFIGEDKITKKTFFPSDYLYKKWL